MYLTGTRFVVMCFLLVVPSTHSQSSLNLLKIILGIEGKFDLPWIKNISENISCGWCSVKVTKSFYFKSLSLLTNVTCNREQIQFVSILSHQSSYKEFLTSYETPFNTYTLYDLYKPLRRFFLFLPIAESDSKSDETFYGMETGPDKVKGSYGGIFFYTIWFWGQKWGKEKNWL